MKKFPKVYPKGTLIKCQFRYGPGYISVVIGVLLYDLRSDYLLNVMRTYFPPLRNAYPTRGRIAVLAAEKIRNLLCKQGYITLAEALSYRDFYRTAYKLREWR